MSVDLSTIFGLNQDFGGSNFSTLSKLMDGLQLQATAASIQISISQGQQQSPPHSWFKQVEGCDTSIAPRSSFDDT